MPVSDGDVTCDWVKFPLVHQIKNSLQAFL
jgi:hypothetical protein